MITLGYNRAAKAFDPSILNSFDEVGSVGGRVHRETPVVSGVPLRPIVAEAVTPDVCSVCVSPIIAFTGSYDNGQGFRLDGASMERCLCGTRLAPRRYVQPDREVVTPHCLESIAKIQQTARTVKCGSRKCHVTFDLVGSTYQVYCCIRCRKSEILARRMEREKEERRQRREAAAAEKEIREAVRTAAKSLRLAMALAKAVA